MEESIMNKLADLTPMLILSPHLDDAALAMADTLYDAGMETKVRHAPRNRLFFYSYGNHPGLSTEEQEQYNRENHEFTKAVNCLPSWTDSPSINGLETERPISFYINELENFINMHRPRSIFIPAPDYNQDHRRVYDIASVAIRPHDKNYYIDNVFLYEQPCTRQAPMHSTFQPNLFVPVDIEKKLELWDIYKTQHRSYRSPEHLRALAKLRGSQCNWPYAEAFQVVRMTL